MSRSFYGILFLLFFSCQSGSDNSHLLEGGTCVGAKGALLGTQFSSFDELKKVIDIKYKKDKTSRAIISHRCNSLGVESILKDGVSEKDLEKAQSGGLKEKLFVAVNSPYVIVAREDLKRIVDLSRRKGDIFGEGDKSFYDIAYAMMRHINRENLDSLQHTHFTEKGYINTFNHLTAQALITSIFSEKLADYIADTHELGRMPELVTGNFTKAQILDLDNGPVDNYVDIINNEWGQELGKMLKEKYSIDRSTSWNEELLLNYLNDVQAYCSWIFKIPMSPFREQDELIVKFSKKINKVMGVNY